MTTAMARSRSEDELDSVFAALGNPTRRSLVRRLARGDATISQLAEPFDMTLPAISKHLLVLERAGLVRRERDGRSRRCTLEVDALDAAETWIADCRQFWNDTLTSLSAYLESGGDDPGADR